MEKAVLSLPDGYSMLCEIDLKKNKKVFLFVNALSFFISFCLILLGLLFGPAVLPNLNADLENMPLYFAKLAVLLLGFAVYIVLHELIHGVFMRFYSRSKVHYGFTASYAYAGSDAFFAKRPYCVIALAPVVIWGLVLAALCLLLPQDWFWIFYLIQVINVGGAAGDFYVMVKMLPMPSTVLVRDTGVSMTVYGKKQ